MTKDESTFLDSKSEIICGRISDLQGVLISMLPLMMETHYKYDTNVDFDPEDYEYNAIFDLDGVIRFSCIYLPTNEIVGQAVWSDNLLNIVTHKPFEIIYEEEEEAI